MFDELKEVTYLKKYYNYFDQKVKSFVSSDLIKADVDEEYNDTLNKLSKNGQFYEIKRSSIETQRKSSLDSPESFNKKNKGNKRKRTIIDYVERKEIANKNNKIKSIKSLAVEVKSNVAITTRFLKRKMLMFAETSLKGFVYDMIDVFMYPDDAVQKIYKKHQVKTCKLYQNLTDADGTSLTFVFICNHESTICEKDSRRIIFEVMIASKILNRLELSDDFWAQFDVQNKKLKKQVGLHEIESINNPNILTISINPKEYFEKCRDKNINKKHKGLKRDTPGMDFEAYSSRLASLHEFCDKPKTNKIKQKRFQIINSSMRMVSVNKTQFAGLNDKRFYFHDGIVSLLFGHYLLEDSRKEKEKFK